MYKIPALTLLLLLCSCTKEKTFYFKTDNAEGLTAASVFLIKGIEIGEIEKIELTPRGQILIEASIKSELMIPEDSEFRIANAGLTDPKIIDVKLGNSKKMISETDTIKLLNEKSISNDSLINGMTKIVNKVLKTDKNDSILRELERLNEKLEKLKNQQQK